MSLPSDSCFDGLVSFSDRNIQLSEIERIASEKPNAKLLLDTGENGLDRNLAAALRNITVKFKNAEFYALLFSDRQIALIKPISAPNVRFGAYFPGDAPLALDDRFNLNVAFGRQVDLLRKVALVAGGAFALVNSAGVSDAYHFTSMIAPHAGQVLFWDDSETRKNAEICAAFQELTNSAG